MHNRLDCFAVTAPGLESLAAAELRALGISAVVEQGGASWTGDVESLAIANLWLRTASRVIVRIAEFKAEAFYELERRARRIPWGRFVARGAAVHLRVTTRKSKLYHSDAVAQRIAEAIERGAGATTAGEGQLFVVRVFHDAVTVSADSSGALLHLRGYRQAVAKAPVRETLAAAVLLGSRWRGDMPLTDPMCGAGTIPIEGAMIARRIAPGCGRRFAFFDWPETPRELWPRLVAKAEAAQLQRSPVAIEGSDRDEGGIAAARANAERAGVAGDIEFSARTISAMEPRPAPGLIATNPPYGIRVGDADRLRNLYAQLGNVTRRNRPGWMVALLSADTRLDQQLALPLKEEFRTTNGGIPVHLVVGTA
jgi:putative N6-adenine-specific DNA methylase